MEDSNHKKIFEGMRVRIYTFYSEEDPELNSFTEHEVKYFDGDDYPAFDLNPNLTEEINGLAYMVCSTEFQHYEIIED